MGRRLVNIGGLFLSLLLIIAALSKAAGLGEFAGGIVREFRFSANAGLVSAVAIVAGELFAGAGFFFRRTRKISAAVAALLFLLFLAVTLHKVNEGSEFECDCFGILRLQMPLLLHVLLDASLMVIALLVMRQTARSNRSLPQRFPLPILLLASASVILLTWSMLPDPKTEPVPEERKAQLDIAFPVRVSIARRTTLVKGILTSGLSRPARRVELVSKVSGQVVAATAYDGKAVAKGELVAEIDKAEFRLAFERASSALLAAQIEYRTLSTSPFLQTMDTMQARRDLEAAREHLQRVRTAYAAGRIDGPAFNRARREYDVARAYFSVDREDVIANRSGLALAQEAYERARLELEATEIRAPFAGSIAGWEIAAGTQVRAGQPLCSLIDVSHMLIDVDIVEAEAGSIHVGSSAVISCMAFPGIQFSGTVRTISPVIDVRTQMMRGTVEFAGGYPGSNARLALVRPGMFATVRIETERFDRRLLVPREAVLVRDLRSLVFTMERGLAKWHYVETGEENQDCLEVKSGIAEGDTVIVDGHHALAHDARVYVKE